jgi:hypothetical protein
MRAPIAGAGMRTGSIPLRLDEPSPVALAMTQGRTARTRRIGELEPADDDLLERRGQQTLNVAQLAVLGWRHERNRPPG